jgi:hypothetical protein
MQRLTIKSLEPMIGKSDCGFKENLSIVSSIDYLPDQAKPFRSAGETGEIGCVTSLSMDGVCSFDLE